MSPCAHYSPHYLSLRAAATQSGVAAGQWCLVAQGMRPLRTIPLAPYLRGRGQEIEFLRDTLRLLPKGHSPSGLPLPVVAPVPVIASRSDAIWGCGGAVVPRGPGYAPAWHHPPSPLPERKGERDRGSEGHPQTPARGAQPLWTPPAAQQSGAGAPADSHALADRSGHPQTPAKGAQPLWTSPAAQQSGAGAPADSHALADRSGHPQTPAKGAQPLWTSPAAQQSGAGAPGDSYAPARSSTRSGHPRGAPLLRARAGLGTYGVVAGGQIMPRVHGDRPVRKAPAAGPLGHPSAVGQLRVPLQCASLRLFGRKTQRLP